MKQRVVVALATVWLASIVGASVPSGEAAAFSTPRPPGPSPDQYTPLFRNPRYYSQDDYSQVWMNDEPSRIKVANRQENSVHGETPAPHSDRQLPFESTPKEFHNRRIIKAHQDAAIPYHFPLKDKTQSELDREAIRLASMKTAFDEPIDLDLSDNTSDEDWTNDSLDEDEGMQRDEFISDTTFEDEGPGSVEVYKLDLYKDRSILSPKPSKKNYLKNKSKIPKKVEAVDQITWKIKHPEEPKQHIVKTASRFDHHSEEFSPPTQFKERIFGVGGVPELQVGCEGVEASERQKRSNSAEESGERNSNQTGGINARPSARATSLYLDVDYESEEDFDAADGTDELFKILSQATTSTESSLLNRNRGDMDPRVKTPADLEANKLKKKDKLPVRGDLGPSGDSNLTEATQVKGGSISNENQSQHKTNRRVLSMEEEQVKNARNKRNSEWGYPETQAEDVTNERRRHGHRGGRKHREKQRWGNKNSAIDKNEEDYFKKPEDPRKENRHASIVRSQPSNLLRQLPTRKNRGHEDYATRYEQQLDAEKRNVKKHRISDENKRELEYHKRINTPIPRRQRTQNNQRSRHYDENKLRTITSGNQAPQNRRYAARPAYNIEADDEYTENRRRLLEQRQREVEHINRPTYKQDSQSPREQKRPQSTERPKDQRQRKPVYHPLSQPEIARLKALPVSAYIYIDNKKPNEIIPEIANRFNDKEVGFVGLNPLSNGPAVSTFPAPSTAKPPVEGLSPCTWAIMTCCSNQDRLATCFEAKACYHGYWDDPCSQEKVYAALKAIGKFSRG